MTDILYTPFFKHLFLDGYVLKNEGYYPEITCEIFSKYLKDSHIHNELTEMFNKNYYNSNYKVNVEFNYNEFLIDLIKSPLKIKSYSKFILLSGYSHGIEGHAVNFYIEKITSDNYNLSIINSGEGLNYHPKMVEEGETTVFLKGGSRYDDETPGEKETIVMTYYNITFEQIYRLLIFTLLSISPYKRNLIKKNINFVDDLIFNFKSQKWEKDNYYSLPFQNPFNPKEHIHTTINERIANLNDIIQRDKDYKLLIYNLKANGKKYSSSYEDKYDYDSSDGEKYDYDSSYEDEDEDDDTYIKTAHEYQTLSISEINILKNEIIKRTTDIEKNGYIDSKFPFLKEFVIKDGIHNLIYTNMSIDVFYKFIKDLIPNFETPDFFL